MSFSVFSFCIFSIYSLCHALATLQAEPMRFGMLHPVMQMQVNLAPPTHVCKFARTRLYNCLHFDLERTLETRSVILLKMKRD